MPISHSILDFKGTITSNYLNERIYNLLDQTFEVPRTGFSFNVFEVSKEYVARPDLVSLDAYGNVCYTDVICKINGISNPFELNEGMEIIIPTTASISEFTVKPGKMDVEDDEYDNMPIPTTVSNKKRKANEAVIGDTRFRIDSSAGVIIY